MRHNPGVPRAVTSGPLRRARNGGDGEHTSVEFDGTAGRIPHLRTQRRKPDGIFAARGPARRAVRAAVRRGDGVRGVARGADGFSVHSHRRAVHQHPARIRTLDDSREQHRANDRLGGGIAGGGRDVHDPGAYFSRFRLRVYVLAYLPAGSAGRVARRAVHDSAAAAAHRERARGPDVSRRHGLRRRSGGGRARWLLCRTRVLGTRPGRRVHLRHEHGAGVDLSAGSAAELVPRRFLPRHDHQRIPGRGLHHRAESCRHSLRRRRDLLAPHHARHSVFRAARGQRDNLSVHHPHPANDSG